MQLIRVYKNLISGTLLKVSKNQLLNIWGSYLDGYSTFGEVKRVARGC